MCDQYKHDTHFFSFHYFFVTNVPQKVPSMQRQNSFQETQIRVPHADGRHTIKKRYANIRVLYNAC